MKKLLIIDSNSIINRAFYGVRYLSSKDGTPTNAIYGFLNTLFKLIDEVKPDYICTAFDLKAPTFRHKMYDGYKAQRKPMPDGLRVQIPIAKEILKAMNIKSFELEGFEADDIIGTVSKICDDSEVACLIATGDKDDLQLATDKTTVILTVTKSGVNETTYYDEAAVRERYHVSPTEFIDIKALMGDSSDNIPGVSGIGEKTAISLIEKYSSVEYIYEHIDELDIKGAMLNKLKAGKDSAFMSKTLATIVRDVPIEFNFDLCQFQYPIQQNCSPELYNILNKLNLNSIIKRLNLTCENDEVEKTVTDIYKGTEFTTAEAPDELSSFLSKAKGNLSLVFEFQGSSPTAVAAAYGKKACVTELSSKNQAEIFNLLQQALDREDIKIIGCGMKEYLVRLSDFLHFPNNFFDVEIAEYLINPAKSDYSIEALLFEYFGIELQSDNEKKQLSIFDDETDLSLTAKKALALEPLYQKTSDSLKANEQEVLYFDIELPLVSVLADMEIAGVYIDKEQLQSFSDMLAKKIDFLTKEIYTSAGEEFNINSPKQLGAILFEKLSLKSGKKTKRGYSTNIEVLQKLQGSHPIIDYLIEYRQLSKLKSTYCDGLSAVISPKTGRIHSQFKQTVTVTGRISSTEPNLQNIPVRTELGRELRKMFIAEKEDYVLVDADYSQIELRVLAHIANDETMINAFKNNEDIHTVTAAQVLGIPFYEVTPEQRSSAKAVNFGIVYGIGEFSLAQDINTSVKEAKAYINSYLDKYHGVREYMERIKEEAKNNGYVKTMMNRIRYIPELKSSNYNMRAFGERVALNTPIQGTAADIIKLAMVKVHERLKKEGLKARLILQVHDELIIEAPKSECETVKQLLREEMENVAKLNVPLCADTAVGRSWYDAK